MSNTEQTLSIIKPDAVERNLDNEIKQIFIKSGFNILKESDLNVETKPSVSNLYSKITDSVNKES